MTQEDLLRKLEAELETLRFESFSFDDALAIGLDLVETARRKALPIAIDVTVNQQQLFHAGLPGSSPDNDQWVLRKSRVATRFFKSSLAIATELRIKGKTIEEVWGLPSAQYAPSGGSVPVLVKGGVRVEEGSNSKLLVDDITPLEDAQPKLPTHLRIKVPLETASSETIDALQTICRERKGEARVLFDLERKDDFIVVMEAEGYNVLPDRAFINRVEELCGRGSVRVLD